MKLFFVFICISLLLCISITRLLLVNTYYNSSSITTSPISINSNSHFKRHNFKKIDVQEDLQIKLRLLNSLSNTRRYHFLIALREDSKDLRSNFVSVLRRFGIKVKYEYKLLPLFLVECYPKELKSLLEKSQIATKIKSISLNRVYKVALYPVSNHDKIEIKQITYVTANESIELIGAKNVWEKGIKGKKIIVAIIDTGIDKKHPDLCFSNGTTKVIYEKSFVLTTFGYPYNDTDPRDKEGHGTSVAGIIAGTGNRDPEKGIGVAPEALLINAKVFIREVGGLVYATDAGIIAALEWVSLGPDGIPNTGDEADVINMSLGGPTWYTDPLALAIERISKMGITVVVAAGNEGDSGRNSASVGSPGDVDAAITVGAIDPQYLSLKFYSSFGPTIRFAVKPDVVAPAGILGITLTPFNYSNMPLEGTSFSAPHVAGAAALIAEFLKEKGIPKSQFPSIIKAALMKTAKAITGYGELAIGAGLIHVDGAINLLESEISKGEIKLVAVLPTTVPTGYTTNKPFFPYKEKIFRNMNIVFNISICITYNTTLRISLSTNLLDIFELHTSTFIDAKIGTMLWEFNATVRGDAPLGKYVGSITIADVENNIIAEISISFGVADPVCFLAFDMKHTSWVPTDFKFGQYRETALVLEDLGVAVEHIFVNQKYDASTLSRYDIVFAPDTATYYYLYAENGSVVEVAYLGYTSEEIADLKEWVSNGGILIIICMHAGKEYGNNELENVNNVTREFGFEFSEILYTGDEPIPLNVTSNTTFTYGVVKIPFWGMGINIIKPNVIPFAFYKENEKMYPVMVASILPQNDTVGLVFGFGTNFFFDNWALSGQYGGVPRNATPTFLANLINFVKIKDKLGISIPDEVDGEVYDVYLKTPLSVHSVYVKDSQGISNIISIIKASSNTYYFRYAPRVEGSQILVALLKNESIEAEVYLPLIKLITARASYTDNQNPAIKVISQNPGNPSEFDNIELELNITDNLWISKVKFESSTKIILATYNISTGCWKIILEAPGAGSMSVSLTVEVVDGFGNTVRQTFGINLTPMTIIGVGVVIAIIAIVAVIIIIRRRKR